MQSNQASSEVLNHIARRALVAKILNVMILLSSLAFSSGILTNLLSEFHFYRFTLNIVCLVSLIVIFVLVQRDKIIAGFNLAIITFSSAIGISVLLNGGVQVPVYAGFFFIFVATSVFLSERMMYVTFGTFVGVGAISLLLPFQGREVTQLPSPFRYWTLYVLIGLAIVAILSLVRKALQDAVSKLTARESLLTSIFNSTSDPLIVMNQNRQVTHMNPSAKKLNQQILDEFNNELLKTLVIHTDTQQQSTLLDIIDPRSTESQTFNINLMKGGERYWFIVSVSPQLNNGQVSGVVIFIRDVSDQYHITQSQKMEAIGLLANGIAHDFNNMLGAIRSASDLLALDVDDEQRELVEVIGEATHRSAELTAQLMLFSRSKPSKPQAFDVHQLLTNISLLLKRIGTHKLPVNLVLTAESSQVIGDESQIHSALMNLGVNGLQAMGSSGCLHFITSIFTVDETNTKLGSFTLDLGHYIRIQVKDEGMGMSPEVLDRVFEPFFTTKEMGKGSGLGLATVYGSIQQHGGGIEIQSELNVGTVVTVLLPLKKEEDSTPHPSIESSIQESQDKTLHGMMILVIDDEPLIRKSLSVALRSLGIKSDAVESGDAGVALLRSGTQYDMVILDMLMPEKSGKEVFYELKEEYPELPVIVSTGFVPEEVIAELKAQGLAGVLNKPYTMDNLKKVLVASIIN